MSSRVVLLSILLIAFNTLLAQLPIDSKTGQVKYTEVVDIEGSSKEKIYQKAKLWIVSTLKSGDNMVELSGTNSDQVVGTGNLVLDSIASNEKDQAKAIFWPACYVNFKFIVFAKDNKLKYSVENIQFSYRSANARKVRPLEDIAPLTNWKEEKKEEFRKANVPHIDRKIKALVSDFIANMKADASEDW